MKKENGTWYENPGGIPQSNEWYTPPKVFDKLQTTFDLDVAAPKGGVPWIPATDHYYKEIDGLIQPWYGFVWCNPPYGKNTGIWLKKFIEHGNGIALVFSRTDTIWFHDYATQADILCFIKARLKFYKGDIESKQVSTGNLLIGCGTKAINVLEQTDIGYSIKV